jgi:hypothetical protein
MASVSSTGGALVNSDMVIMHLPPSAFGIRKAMDGRVGIRNY